MPNVTSTLLQIIDMEVGGNDNTWGATTTDNLTKLENAIAASATISSTGGATTLTDDQARDAILSFTGALASDHTVTVPSRSKWWIVKNGHTLGSYALKFKTSSGSAVSLPATPVYSLVYCDGLDIVVLGTSISNERFATMATKTVKANITGSTAPPVDVTIDALLAASTDNTLDGAKILAASIVYAKIASAALADAAAYRANTASKLLSAATPWAAADFVALTDGSSIALDLSTGINFSVTLGGNRTLANPTNPKVGQSGVIMVSQDGTGSRTLSFGSYYKFADGTAVTIDSTASRTSLLSYFVMSSTSVAVAMLRGVR